MKRKSYILLTAIAMLFCIGNSHAAFLVKKQAIIAVAETKGTAPSAATAEVTETPAPVAATEITTAKKQNFFAKTWQSIKAAARAAMPIWAYIILSIFWLGWLAMGINDDFQGFDWVLSLILYILFYFPGLIYSLIKIGKYY